MMMLNSKLGLWFVIPLKPESGLLFRVPLDPKPGSLFVILLNPNVNRLAKMVDLSMEVPQVGKEKDAILPRRHLTGIVGFLKWACAYKSCFMLRVGFSGSRGLASVVSTLLLRQWVFRSNPGADTWNFWPTLAFTL
jgi:hypothetical protein